MKALLFTSLLMMTLLWSCTEESTNISTGNGTPAPVVNNGNSGGGGSGGNSGGGSSNGGSLPGTGSTSGSSTNLCFAPGIGNQILDYYALPIKGAGNGSSFAQWSSANSSDLQSANASSAIFVTDSRLHVRVVAKPAPFPNNINCHQQLDYGSLSLSVSIKGANSGNYLQTLRFEEVKINECSQVLRYTTIPTNSTSSPIIVEFHDVLWDFDCKWDPIGTSGCPRMTPVWGGNGINACWQIELQMATDDTRDIPW